MRWVISLAGAIWCLVSIAIPAYSTDPAGAYANSRLHQWYQSQVDAAGRSCCAEADGHLLDGSDTDNTSGTWKVHIQNKWQDVPATALLTGPNLAKRPVVWLVGNQIRCFIPGVQL